MGWKDPFKPSKDIFHPRMAKRKVSRQARKAISQNQAKQRQQQARLNKHKIKNYSHNHNHQHQELTTLDIIITVIFFMAVAWFLIWAFN